MDSKIRLQKIIANAGVASRREAERLIEDGLVTVNGKVITDLGTKVDPEDSHIKVRGKLILRESRKVYLALNKPVGYVTTQHDPEGRPTVMDLIHGIRERLFPVGRLDFNTEGLLLMTNDGELANAIMHPSFHIQKIYQVKIKGKPDKTKIEKVSRGIHLNDGLTAPVEIRNVRHLDANTTLVIVLHEGRKRQVRRMFDRIGHSVLKLKRTQIGPIRLDHLPTGKFRKLEPREIERLKTKMNPKGKKPGHQTKRKKPHPSRKS